MAQEAIIDGNLINDERPLAVEVQNDSLTVDGPLTDAELRATAVPVSGPLTDAELRATPPEVEMQSRASGTLTTPRLDAATSSTQAVSYAHHEIHSGSAYALHATNADLDTADELSLSFKTPAGTKWLHVVPLVSCSSTARFEILEGPTITNDSGSDIVPLNRNRNSANTSGVYSIKATPIVNQANLDATITVDGVAIHDELLGAGKNYSGGGGIRDADEYVLASSTVYAFRITGIADNGVVSLEITWYEHTDVA